MSSPRECAGDGEGPGVEAEGAPPRCPVGARDPGQDARTRGTAPLEVGEGGENQPDAQLPRGGACRTAARRPDAPGPPPTRVRLGAGRCRRDTGRREDDRGGRQGGDDKGCRPCHRGHLSYSTRSSAPMKPFAPSHRNGSLGTYGISRSRNYKSAHWGSSAGREITDDPAGQDAITIPWPSNRDRSRCSG